MERLICSNPIPSKLHLIQRVDAPLKLGLPSRRLNSISCSKLEKPSSLSCTRPPEPQRCLANASSLFFSRSRRIASRAAGSRTIILLSALLALLIHPVFVFPAFATFQNAANAGATAAAAAGSRLIRSELLSSAWTGFFAGCLTGFFAGCLHTLSGRDHLAALAPLSIGRTRIESAAVGVLWGCGHDAGQVIFGLLFLLKDRLRIEVLRAWGTRVVVFTLIVIGAMGIREASEVPTPCVALENGECNVAVYEAPDNPTTVKKRVRFATFATRNVHGLQPDALKMVLPTLALPSRLAGGAFLCMFLVGTVIAMVSYTVFLGSCSQALKERVSSRGPLPLSQLL